MLWEVVLSSSAPLLGDSGTALSLRLIDRFSGLHSEAYQLDGSSAGPAEALFEPPKPTERGADGVRGWARRGVIRVPASIKAPGAVLVTKAATTPTQPSIDYLTHIDVVLPDAGLVHFPCHSWVSSDHGERVFFEGAARLPRDTPPALVEARARELAILRGEGAGKQGTKRAYQYATYDDLWDEKKHTAPPADRPPLGFGGGESQGAGDAR